MSVCWNRRSGIQCVYAGTAQREYNVCMLEPHSGNTYVCILEPPRGIHVRVFRTCSGRHAIYTKICVSCILDLPGWNTVRVSWIRRGGIHIRVLWFRRCGVHIRVFRQRFNAKRRVGHRHRVEALLLCGWDVKFKCWVLLGSYWDARGLKPLVLLILLLMIL